MKGFPKFVCLVLAISLSFGVIWPVPAADAAVAPIDFLEQVKAGLGAPGALDLDSSGNLYVADASTGVQKYNVYGTLTASYSAIMPTGVGLAVNSASGYVYVAAADQVVILDTDLVQVGTLGAGVGEFRSVGAIDVDGLTGKVYVADGLARTVKVFTAAGAYDSEFSTFIAGCDSMTGLAVDENVGEIYISFRQGTVQVGVFDLSGNHLRSIPADSGFGAAMYSLAGTDLAPGEGLAFFADYVGNRISIVELTGVLPAGDTYDTAGQLIGPTDLAYDPGTSRLFVATAGGISVYGIGTDYTLPVNRPPSAPTLIAPLGGSEVVAAPTLSFSPSVDPEGDAVTYTVEIADLGLFSGLGGTQFAVPGELQENGCYSWKVRASDGMADSAWSSTGSFCVNAGNEAPTAPLLQSPLAGESLRAADLLSWSAATDADPNDSLGYVVEVAGDATFAAPVLAAVATDTASALQDLAGYAELTPGASYFWRVLAVDSQGAQTASANVGQFAFDDIRLTVSANMPGAEVFLGGNQIYAGQFVGTAPVELADLPEGSYSVVVERAGFETFVAQVELAAGSSTQLKAELLPAIGPEQHAVQKGGMVYYGSRRLVEVNYGAEKVAPVMADLDSDGILDLLVMGQAGWLHFYKGKSLGDRCVFAEKTVLLPVSTVGETPFVVDWNNDGRKDLLVGSRDGSISLVPNSGSVGAPRFDLARADYVQADNGPIVVAADAVPVVADLNGDRAKDLLVGAADGQVVAYLNTGSDADPVFAAGTVLTRVAGPVAPAVTDWDADGAKDLLLAQDGKLLLARNNGTGYDAPVQISTAALGNGLRVCVLDVDLEQGKDLVVGDATGKVAYLESRGLERLPSFGAALLDKVDQIAELTAASGQGVTAQVGALRGTLEQGDLALALVQTEVLLGDLAAGSYEAQAVGELAALLQ